MKLHFTLNSNQGTLDIYLDEPKNTTIEEIKNILIGDTIKNIGYDRIKLYQGGYLLNNQDNIYKLSRHPILIFLTVNEPLRTKITNRFLQAKKENESVTEPTKNDSDSVSVSVSDSDSDLNSDTEQYTEIRTNKLASSRLLPLTGTSFATSESYTEIKYIEADIIEEKVVEKKILTEELDRENLETINKFKQPVFKTLLQLYVKQNEEFVEFLKYLSGGNIKNSDTCSYKPSIELINELREIMPLYQDESNDKISLDLQKMHGNVNLFLTHHLASI